MDSDSTVKTDAAKVTEVKEIIIPPLRSTASIEISSDQPNIIREIAKNQLENLNKKPKRKNLSTSDTETTPTALVHDARNKNLHNLTSAIVSKADIENEIRTKVAQQVSVDKKTVGTIEIPQELILSGLDATPTTKDGNQSDNLLHDQELIDILEGKSGDETELFEVISEEGGLVIVKDAKDSETTSYEIIPDPKISEAKAKLMEREIAMRQIASLPVRKNKRTEKPKSFAQSIAAEWEEEQQEEMILEVTNVEDGGEPKIKILNMTILNEQHEVKPQPKILNKEAPKSPPKILNINASAAEPAAFKRSRVVKKKEIWDPSEEKKAMPLNLPPSITIKKVTKETISKANEEQKPVAKKVIKKRSEIDKLLQDEGAVNMIYSLERENNNQDVAEPEEKSIATKAKAIKSAVIKQSVSPPEPKPRGRPKRDPTPVKTEEAKPTPAGRKKKPDNSWDFMYSQAQATCDDAMIIRRRSNSSYSSSAASPRRLSVDVNESLESPPASAKNVKEAFEFTKPPSKTGKSPADKVLSKDFVEELRGKISNEITKAKEKPVPAQRGRKRVATEPLPTQAKRASERRANGSDHKEYRLVKEGKVAQIIISQNPLSISLLSEMKTLLNQLETDECSVVLITSSEGFSEGLDYSTLVQTTVDKRKQAASDLVTAFK